MGDDELKIFTVTEARNLLPKLRRLLARVISERERVLDLRIEIEAVREKSSLDSGSPYGPAYLSHLTAFTEAIEEVRSLGVQIKDFRTGLVDFPHEMGGRVVYLCWKFDEDEINWWHEVDAGFAGRQLLDEESE
jgi:hypothetical protein